MQSNTRRVASPAPPKEEAEASSPSSSSTSSTRSNALARTLVGPGAANAVRVASIVAVAVSLSPGRPFPCPSSPAVAAHWGAPLGRPISASNLAACWEDDSGSVLPLEIGGEVSLWLPPHHADHDAGVNGQLFSKRRALGPAPLASHRTRTNEGRRPNSSTSLGLLSMADVLPVLALGLSLVPGVSYGGAGVCACFGPGERSLDCCCPSWKAPLAIWR